MFLTEKKPELRICDICNCTFARRNNRQLRCGSFRLKVGCAYLARHIFSKRYCAKYKTKHRIRLTKIQRDRYTNDEEFRERRRNDKKRFLEKHPGYLKEYKRLHPVKNLKEYQRIYMQEYRKGLRRKNIMHG